MTQTLSLEKLQKQNRDLKAALEKSQTAAHDSLVYAGSFDHRGAFYNCPAEDCVYVRVLLGKDEGQG